MESHKQKKSGIVCLAIIGPMGAELTPELEGVIKRIAAHGRRQVLFDLDAVEYLAAPTLRVLLKAIKRINQRRGKVAMCSLNGYVREIFEDNCFRNSFAIADSVESGIATLLNHAKAA
jgi:anti-anti-sigma factor